MKRTLLLIAILVASSVAALSQGTQSPTTTPAPRPTPVPLTLKVGDMAPDFTLRATDGKTVKLSDFRSKSNVVLAFYVLAFTGG